MMNFSEYNDLLSTAYSNAVMKTKQSQSKWNCDMRTFTLNGKEYIVQHDHGEGYECFMSFGKISISDEKEDYLVFNLPSYGWDEYENDEYSILERITDVKKSLADWENITFNTSLCTQGLEIWNDIPNTQCTVDNTLDQTLIEHFETQLLNIKSISQIEKDIPDILNKIYDAMILTFTSLVQED